jgi:hypothetical protein
MNSSDDEDMSSCMTLLKLNPDMESIAAKKTRHVE